MINQKQRQFLEKAGIGPVVSDTGWKVTCSRCGNSEYFKGTTCVVCGHDYTSSRISSIIVAGETTKC